MGAGHSAWLAAHRRPARPLTRRWRGAGGRSRRAELAAARHPGGAVLREWLPATSGRRLRGTSDPAEGTYELPAEQAWWLQTRDRPVSFRAAGVSRSSVPVNATNGGSRTRSAPAPGSAGTSTTTGCFSGCAALPPWITRPHLGKKPWLPGAGMAGVEPKRRAGGQGRGRTTSAAGLGALHDHPWRRLGAVPPSSAWTTTRPRSTEAAQAWAEEGAGGGSGPADQVRTVPRPPRSFPGPPGLRTWVHVRTA